MSATGILLLTAFILFLLKIFSWVLKTNRYWKDLGIPYEKPLPFFGSSLRLLSATKSDLLKQMYFNHKDEPFFGLFEFMGPQLVVRDPELIGKILIKDFGHFVDHGMKLDEENDWIDMSIIAMTGDKWRTVRTKLLPAFTTGKLRGMHGQMVESANDLIGRLKEYKGGDVDTKEEMARYGIEVIASVAFGMDATRSDPKFRFMGSKGLDFTLTRYIGFLLIFNFPRLAKLLKFSMTRPDVGEYFAQIIQDNFDYRRKNNVTRNDFVQLLLQLKEKGYVEIQSKEADDDYLMLDSMKVTETIEFTDKMLVAQAFTFIQAGFEAISLSIAYVLLELAKNPDLQEKARKDVMDSYKKNGNQFNYQALKEMTYLEMFIHETGRLYSLVSFLLREVTKDYQLEGRGGKIINLKTGTKIVIPVVGLHNDPNYWPDPDKFDPERFAPDSPRTPNTYIPFGDGPRMCIGMRFALLQVKQGVATILKEFKIEMSPKVKFPLKMKKNTIIASPEDPLYMRFKKLDEISN